MVQMSNIETLLKDYRNILILAGIFFIFCGLAEILNFRPFPGSESYFRAIGGIFLTIGIILYVDVKNRKYIWLFPLIIGFALFSIPVHPPIPTITPTPIPTVTPTPSNIIDSMESTMVWYTHKDDMGSSLNRKLIPGKTDNGIEISYDLKEGGWVLISKVIDPEILSEYEGIRFYYKGSGEPNTIELKLIYEDTTTFAVEWHGATVADDWVSVEVPYSGFNCLWPADNCQRHGNELDLKKVKKIEFAISNKPDHGDAYGSGWVIIDDVQGIVS